MSFSIDGSRATEGIRFAVPPGAQEPELEEAPAAAPELEEAQEVEGSSVAPIVDRLRWVAIGSEGYRVINEAIDLCLRLFDRIPEDPANIFNDDDGISNFNRWIGEIKRVMEKNSGIFAGNSDLLRRFILGRREPLSVEDELLVW